MRYAARPSPFPFSSIELLVVRACPAAYFWLEKMPLLNSWQCCPALAFRGANAYAQSEDSKGFFQECHRARIIPSSRHGLSMRPPTAFS